MEEVIAVAIGVLAASGVWLILRPRTYQVIMGLCLLSYGVNLFIFSMGSLFIGKEPIIKDGVTQDLLHYTDPLPQALVLTAIVITFGMTAFVVILALANLGTSFASAILAKDTTTYDSQLVDKKTNDAVATATAVAQTGLIAFIGLVAPQLVRSQLRSRFVAMSALSSDLAV